MLVFIFALVFIIAPTHALAQDTISVSGDPGNLTISSATAGQQPDSVVDSSTTLTYSTDSTAGTREIVASVDQALPSGVTLRVKVGSGSYVALNTSPAVVASGIGANQSNVQLGITYELSATVAAGVVALQNRTVTFTIQMSQ
jgi:hypothetical protein